MVLLVLVTETVPNVSTRLWAKHFTDKIPRHKPVREDCHCPIMQMKKPSPVAKKGQSHVYLTLPLT